ncbi:MAG: hypothetical protein AAF564_26555, partial [Bacteroidota bacterium]
TVHAATEAILGNEKPVQPKPDKVPVDHTFFLANFCTTSIASSTMQQQQQQQQQPSSSFMPKRRESGSSSNFRGNAGASNNFDPVTKNGLAASPVAAGASPHQMAPENKTPVKAHYASGGGNNRN